MNADGTGVTQLTDTDSFNGAADWQPGTVVINMPPNKNACKNGGWQNYTDDEGNPFSNQGQCISFVNHQD